VRYYLNQLATQEALVRDAEARGITVTDEEVEQQIMQVQESLGGEEAFQQTLTELGYEDVEAYRDDVREGLLTQRVVDEIRGEIEVTDEDVSSYYEENQEQFGEVSLDEIRDQLRNQLVGERLDQRFQDLQEEYGVQANPDVLLDAETEGDM
jgi:foldase protein PrsA